MRQFIRIYTLFILLCFGCITNEAWAAKVTYHILTLPIDNSIYHMNATFSGKRLEAVRVIVDPATKVELPAEYKSPLAKNFRYYLSDKVTQNAAAQSYDISAKNKSRYYSIPDATDSITTASYSVTSNIDVYVTYEYDNTKGILLNGSASYNLPISGGFVALNRGRNNRLAVIREDLGIVSAEDLVSEDFVKLTDKDKIPGTNITTYWNGNTANPKASVAGQFHFMFQFVGFDPYNILIRTAYDKNYTYLEKHGSESNLLYKWYKGSYLFKPSSDGNCFMASDDHKVYTQTGSSYNPDEDPAITSSTSTGYFHNKGASDITYNSFVLLNNTSGTGYIFMVSRPVGDNGDLSDPKATKNNPSYTFLVRDGNYNNLTFASKTLAEASKDYSTDQKIYPIRDVNFKVKTPFYAIEATSAHIVTAAAQLSQYTIDNDDIDADFIPAELRRKYCNFPGTFRDKDGKAITKYSQAYNEDTETYDIYVDYTVQNAPFTAIAPKSTAYTAAELNAASWYELTDDGSTEASGKKITAYESSGDYKFKNNGASGTFNKNSEYAFIGDPYELRVILRSTTTNTASPLGPHYVGVTGDTPSTGTDFTVGASATKGYKWEIPYDATAGSFNLRIYTTDCSGTGYWSWATGNASVYVTYDGTTVDGVPALTSNPQTVTLNVTGLTYAVDNYLEVTKSGDGSGQVGTITIGDISSTGTATITAAISANSSSNKEFMLTITEKNGSGSTVGTATAVNFTQGTSAYAGGNVQYNTTATRVRVLNLPTKTFTYKIVDKSGRIAVKASIKQTIFTPLSTTVTQRLESSLPPIIVSPFLVGETLAFYDSYTNRNSDSKLSRLDFHNPSEQTTITETPNANHDIFVTYTTEHLSDKPFKLSEDQEFNVVLNGQYLYYDSSNGGAVKSNSSPSDSDKGSAAYLWKLRNRDPYAMLIDNMGARATLEVEGVSENPDVYDDSGTKTNPERQKGAWVKLAAALGNDVALAFDTDRTHAQQFIAKSSTQGGVYEVMVADGGTNDASTTYYNIGRTSTTDIKIYSNSAYAHGNNVLKFQLEQTIDYTYHLIDKYDHVLLTQKSQSPDLVLPAQYQSPLVADYHYYDKDNIDIDGDKYTVKKDSPVELTALSGLDATFTKTSGDYSSSWESTGNLTATSADDVDVKARKLTAKGHYYYRIGETTTYYDVNVTKELYRDIYVTYDVNDRVKFNDKASPYMLRFLDPDIPSYYLEDGNDKLTTETIQPVYPYCNGDGSLNIYGSAMNEEQMNGGASTRPRWTWFFESEKKDPYHVMIHSSNTISFGGVSHPTYLQTFAVDFNQGATTPKHIVTCGTLPTVASEDITEYMVLGTDGQFKLKTTNEINDGTGSARRDVTTLEQYWKTYNMVKLHVLGISNTTDAFSNIESTWVVPTDPASYRTTLTERGWHSFPIYANATRWNGYNDKTDGHEKKCVERLEHWFQTFDMGDGTFDIESANIPPVLVLLDRHGWEIMRKPLPDISHYPEGDELDALKVYDSPLVKEYKFYSNATKASGCHKYSLRMQNGAERDQIKVNGVHYTSTSLGNLPPISASGVKSSSGVLNDQYVTYTVKDEYENSYTYNFVDHGDGTFTESGTASKFVMVQNGRFYKNRNNNTSGQESYFTKPIFEHTYPEGGNVYDLIVSAHDNAVNGVDDGYGNLADRCKWYVMPNLNIDKEMGIKYAETAGGSGEPLTEYETKKNYFETGKGGFDPYNIQLKNVDENKFLTSHITSANRRNGVLEASYSGTDFYGHSGTTRLTLEDEFNSYNTSVDKRSEGYDHTNLQISNQTFMAVSDVNGNMQLMPRFDHDRRVNLPTTSANNDPWPTTLEESVDYEKGDGIAEVDDNNKMGPQTIFFVRPQRFVYRIIDNDGNEALRYKRAGDYYPTITDHFKSPLATDFKFYKTLSDSNSDGVYELATLADEITGSFAGSGLDGDNETVYVRYSYDESADLDGDKILLGKWFTIKLNDKDVVASGTIVTKDDPATTEVVEVPGTGVSLLQGTSKPSTIDKDAKTWQWKFLVAPIDPSSELHESPDPYAIQIFNRNANDSDDLDEDPNPMSVPIKVNGQDRFTLLRHQSGGYALAVNGLGTYNYSFLNGAAMTTIVAATTAVENNYQRTIANYETTTFDAATYFSEEPDGDYYLKIYDGNKNASYTKYTVTSGTPDAGVSSTEEAWNGAYHFTIKSGVLSPGTQLILNNDVKHNYKYSVINNGGSDYVVDNPGYLAVEATQDDAAAAPNGYAPYLPLEAQSELLNADEDYLYYGSATLSDGKYTVATTTKLFTLYGLYDDQVYVRYKKYNPDKGVYEVPNKRNAKESTTVARDPGSQDVALNIKGELPYNIIWYDNNMMSTETEDATAITDGGKQDLSGLKNYVWYFEGNDPYALKIRHKLNSNYVNGTGTLVASAADAMQFMLLKKTGYDYGILAETGNQNTKLSGYGQTTTTGDPTEFIIFGLSVHDLIYRLIIANIGSSAYIPYAEIEDEVRVEKPDKEIKGTTQRDLTTTTTVTGDTYQLGTTLEWGGSNHTYSHDAGTVSIGDVLEVPSVFDRPNCTFEFYIEGVYDYNKGTGATTENDELNTLYKGLKLKNLMSDSRLIDKTVVVNIVYLFDQTVATNAGLGFVTSTNQNLWYTFETNESTPYLARYTNTQGITAVSGKATHYTNDYLWTPVGDVYGFKMYNRYVLKNSSDSGDDPSRVMTTSAIANNQAVEMLEPVESSPAEGQSLKGYEVYELLADESTPSGCFYVHPVINNSGTQYYLNRVGNSLKLSSGENPTQWTYGLDLAMLQPYYLGAGNVGGLTTTPKAGRAKSGKTLYEEALAKDPVLVTDLQEVVYNDDNIVDFATGYYRLHSQPGITGVSPVRYASGYLHEIEKTGIGTETPGAIPMHFYSKAGVTGTFDGDTNPLESGFTVSNATRGDIPVPATEADPSTIFRIVNGTAVTNRTISNVTMSTQGLNVIGCTMGTGDATTYRLIDIGGGVVILVNTTTGYYFNFNQSSNKYDLKYSVATSSNIDDVKWCMEPANTLGLQVTMNNGGDDYYYATFCAPYDVVLPADDGDKKYYAYVCDKWSDTNLHPTKVPAVTGEPSYAAGKFVPAGTPVIFRIKDESGSMKLTIKGDTPSSPLSSDDNVFSGKYLEQLLDVDAAHDVYTLGLPFTSDVQKDVDYDTTGDINAPLPLKASSGLGFYINATPNKENGALKARWDKNNRYVLHNKIYYREGATPGSSARGMTRGSIDFVPVVFDDLLVEPEEYGGEEKKEEELTERREYVGDGCVYDMTGRRVATEEQVMDGTWKQRVSPGIYIINGKKISVR